MATSGDRQWPLPALLASSLVGYAGWSGGVQMVISPRQGGWSQESSNTPPAIEPAEKNEFDAAATGVRNDGTGRKRHGQKILQFDNRYQ